MPLDLAFLTVAAEGRGFTLWHYRSQTDALAEFLSEGYFDQAAPLLRRDDAVIARGTNGSRLLFVADVSDGRVVMSDPTPSAAPVTSIFGRTGHVVAQDGDYRFDQLADRPTTLAGYGITDAASAARWRQLEVGTTSSWTLAPSQDRTILRHTAPSVLEVRIEADPGEDFECALLRDPGAGQIDVVVSAPLVLGADGPSPRSAPAPSILFLRRVAPGQFRLFGCQPAPITTADVSGLAEALAGKAALAHSHVPSDIRAVPARSLLGRAAAETGTAQTISLGQGLILEAGELRTAPAIHPGFRPGRWYGLAGAGGTFNADLPSGWLAFVPFFSPRPLSIDRLAVTVATASSAQARLGIYLPDADGWPASLLLDAGAIALSPAGLRAVTVATTLPPGVSWLAVQVSANASLVWGASPLLPWWLGSASGTGLEGFLYGTTSFGPLPAVAPTLQTIGATQTVQLQVRIAT